MLDSLRRGGARQSLNGRSLPPPTSESSEEVTMKRKLFVAVGLFAASLLLVPATAWAADGVGTWEIEGTWADRSGATDGWGIVCTITRSGGNEYQMSCDYAGPEYWYLEGRRSTMLGPLWRVGPQEWAWALFGYILDENDAPFWTIVSTGTWEMVASNEIVTDDWWLSLYDNTRDIKYILDGGQPDWPPPNGYYGPLTGGMYRLPHFTLIPPPQP